MRDEDEDIHKPGELVEEQDVVEAVLNRVVKVWVEVRGFDFHLGYVEEISGGYIWVRRPLAKSARPERLGTKRSVPAAYAANACFKLIVSPFLPHS